MGRTKVTAGKNKNATGSSAEKPTKKQKQIAESSSAIPNFDANRFKSATKAERYLVLRRMPFWPEKRVELVREANGEFNLEIIRRHWEILANPPRHYDPEVVLEFYSNAFPEKGQKIGQDARISYVRGHAVDYSRDAIESYLNTGMGLELPEGWRATYQDRIRVISDHPYDAEQTARRLCLDGHTYVANTRGKAMKILRQSMTWLARVWSTFLLHNVAPNKHQSDTRMDYCHLIFAILTDDDIDISQLISDELCNRIVSKREERGTIGFPALITELCRMSHVPRIRASAPIEPPLDDDFIKTVKREAAKTAGQPPPPQRQPIPPHQSHRQTDIHLSAALEHLFLQNSAIMRGQMHQQEVAYQWLETHYPGQHSAYSPQDFATYMAWPGDRPFYPEGGESAAATGPPPEDAEEEDQDDDGDDDDGDGDVGADLERDALVDPFA